MNEIHGLKLGLEKFTSSFEENGETLSDDKLSDRYLIMKLNFRFFSKNSKIVKTQETELKSKQTEEKY